MGHSDLISLKELAKAVIDRSCLPKGPEKPLPPPHSPAYSIIQTCQRYGVLLRIDEETAELVVGKDGASADESTQPWPGLTMALEAHVEDVAALVRAGWTLRADMGREQAA